MVPQSSTKIFEKILVKEPTLAGPAATLTQARADDARTADAHAAFISENPHSNLKYRAHAAVLRALEEQGLFLANHNEISKVIASMTIFRHRPESREGAPPHTEEDVWPELGQARVEDEWQGYGLMKAIVVHVVVQLALARDLTNPIFSIVDAANLPSSKSLDACGFVRTTQVPDGLRRRLADYDWQAIETGKKTLHLCLDTTIATCAEFAAEHRGQITLTSKTRGKPPLTLRVAFPIFRDESLVDDLRKLALQHRGA